MWYIILKLKVYNMLLQFNVENFSSFKNEVILSMKANSDKEHAKSLIPFRHEKVLPSVAIYGPMLLVNQYK